MLERMNREWLVRVSTYLLVWIGADVLAFLVRFGFQFPASPWTWALVLSPLKFPLLLWLVPRDRDRGDVRALLLAVTIGTAPIFALASWRYEPYPKSVMTLSIVCSASALLATSVLLRVNELRRA